MLDPQPVWASVTTPDGEAEDGFALVEEEAGSLRVDLPDGTVVLLDPVELDSARRAA